MKLSALTFLLSVPLPVFAAGMSSYAIAYSSRPVVAISEIDNFPADNTFIEQPAQASLQRKALFNPGYSPIPKATNVAYSNHSGGGDQLQQPFIHPVIRTTVESLQGPGFFIIPYHFLTIKQRSAPPGSSGWGGNYK